jgi:hypothetical protein
VLVDEQERIQLALAQLGDEGRRMGIITSGGQVTPSVPMAICGVALHQHEQPSIAKV